MQTSCRNSNGYLACDLQRTKPMYVVLLSQLHQQMENANFDGAASVLSPEQIQETVRRRVSPLYNPR